jgi:hypothetical protein
MNKALCLFAAALIIPSFAAAGSCDHTDYAIKVALTDLKVDCPMTVGFNSNCTLSGGKWTLKSIEEKGWVNTTLWNEKSGSEPEILLPIGASGCGKNFTFDFKLDTDNPTYKDSDSGKQVAFTQKITGAQAEAFYVDLNDNENGHVTSTSAEKDKHILVTVPPTQLSSDENKPSGGKLIIRDPRLPDGAQTIRLLIETTVGGTPG